MIKTITKIGNSQGIVFDAALMDLARLKVGDQVNITLHEGGTLTLSPVRPEIAPEHITSAIKEIMRDYRGTMKRLA
jgi:antitoxin component of MazEF toxin-antitoxin module